MICWRGSAARIYGMATTAEIDTSALTEAAMAFMEAQKNLVALLPDHIGLAPAISIEVFQGTFSVREHWGLGDFAEVTWVPEPRSEVEVEVTGWNPHAQSQT